MICEANYFFFISVLDKSLMSVPFSKAYSHALTQAIILGLSFTQPGIWDAISAMGAGGLETVETVMHRRYNLWVDGCRFPFFLFLLTS